MDSSLLLLSSSTPTTASKRRPGPNQAVGVWSSEEHDRFLDALKTYPHGPWKAITQVVGTRSVRQVQTHAQKYQEKVFRRLHGMKSGKTIRLRREHRIDHDVLTQETSICFSPKLRHKFARRNLIQPIPEWTPSNAPWGTIEPPLEKTSSSALENTGTSPSSVSTSSIFMDNATCPFWDLDDFSLLNEDDDDNLPTLSESLDFFIENFTANAPWDEDEMLL